MSSYTPPSHPGFRGKLHEIIFEADTRAGKLFDIILIAAIFASVIIVCLESVSSLNEAYGSLFYVLEWVFTIFFTMEYILRLYAVRSPRHYAFSFYGWIDLCAILPTYLELLFPETHFLMVVRSFRFLRIFRILKLSRYLSAAHELKKALHGSRQKIAVFLTSVLIIALFAGTLMYMIEGEEGGFTSIPRGIYWAIVTVTTVGYGDIAPTTALGQIFSVVLMVLGYGIIAVPTGIVTAEMTHIAHRVSTQACPHCAAEGHEYDARFCKYCGTSL